MRLYVVEAAFTVSGPAGTRDYAPGDPATDAELGPYLPDVIHCLTEIAADTPLPPAPEPEL